ncbi:MAG: MSMEG_1061 family FMN-dependent PPOX-type flavoprotein [Gammaproteobacteria bacterium]
MSQNLDDQETLREFFGAPGALAVACMKPALDDYHRRFIALSPFLCLASSTAEGQPFVSPKGDAPGFVTVADERTLYIPDRSGNNKVESFTNIVDNPKVSLIFFVPGLPETLRVLGRASVTTAPEVLALGAARGALPKVATQVAIDTVYFHCGKALVRSKLWQTDSHVDKGAFPSFGRVVREQAGLDISVGETEAIIDDMYTNGLA